jgi:hypothetical protein
MMQKAFLLTATAILASVAAQAGQIQIGQVIGGVNYGLTSTYETGDHTNVNLLAYQPGLFQNANVSSSSMPIATSTAALNVSDPGNDGGATFALIGDPSKSSTTGATWYSTNTAGLSNIIVPINVFDVDTVWTMLNDYGGSAVNATFYFNSTDTTSGATQVSVNLTDGQEIRSGVLCTNGCNAGSSETLVGTNTGVTATGDPHGTITVSTGSIQFPGGTTWSPSYTSIGTGQPDSASTAGNLTLDDQAFQFGNAFSNQYLVQIVFTEANTGISTNHFDLTAVTVDQTPEPSTLGLGFLGIGVAFAFVRKHRRGTRKTE